MLVGCSKTVRYTYGGWAKGIPRNLDTEPEAAPVNVAPSSFTVGEDLRKGDATAMPA